MLASRYESSLKWVQSSYHHNKFLFQKREDNYLPVCLRGGFAAVQASSWRCWDLDLREAWTGSPYRSPRRHEISPSDPLGMSGSASQVTKFNYSLVHPYCFYYKCLDSNLFLETVPYYSVSSIITVNDVFMIFCLFKSTYQIITLLVILTPITLITLSKFNVDLYILTVSQETVV